MVKVSRRGLLHLSAGTAGALGISTLATELDAMSAPSLAASPESTAGDPQTAAPADPETICSTATTGSARLG